MADWGGKRSLGNYAASASALQCDNRSTRLLDRNAVTDFAIKLFRSHVPDDTDKRATTQVNIHPATSASRSTKTSHNTGEHFIFRSGLRRLVSAMIVRPTIRTRDNYEHSQQGNEFGIHTASLTGSILSAMGGKRALRILLPSGVECLEGVVFAEISSV